MPSILSLSATGIYGCVVLACIIAAVTAGQRQQPFSHLRTWLLLAIFFVILACVRFYAIEENLREHLRDSVRALGNYRERRSFQAPIVASILIIVASGSAWFAYVWVRKLRGRRNSMRALGVFAALSMVFLMALRLISFHAIDALLFGPLKINWIVDIGASCTVMGSAIFYTQFVRRRP